MSTRKVRGTKKQTVDLFKQEMQKGLDMSNRRMALIRHKKYWQLKLRMLKTILECIIHNDMSCPYRKCKHFEHCQTSTVVKSQLPDNGRTNTESSPALQINNRRVDHTFRKTHTTLSEHAPGTRMKCALDRETSDLPVSLAGNNVPQQQTFCAVRETRRQPSSSDTCQTVQLFPSSANASYDNGRRNVAMPASNVKRLTRVCNMQAINVNRLTHGCKVPAPINQTMPVSTGSVVVPDCSSQINHTQEDVFNYLHDTTSNCCPMFQQSSLDLDDVLDTMSKHSQPSFNSSSLNSSQQGQENPHSSNAVYHDGSSSLLPEIGYSRPLNRNRKKIRVKEHQACIKPCASKSMAETNGNAEDDDVDKSQAKSQVKFVDSVTVVREMIECLTIDDKKT